MPAIIDSKAAKIASTGVAVGVLLSLIGLGLHSLGNSKAASPFVAAEPELGVVTTPAQSVVATDASGSKAVMFAAPSSSPSPTPVPTPGVCAVSTKHVADGPDGLGGCWPGASNTGVPIGIALKTFADSGACHLTTANVVYDGQIFNCDILVQAAGIKITRSRINGRVSNSTTSASITISDSLIDGGQQETFPSVSYENVTLQRDEVIGGQHSVQCYGTCVVSDSWLHNQYLPSTSAGHVNAFISNGGSGFSFTHNTLHCTVAPTNNAGGCTADASLFGDFSAISDAHFDKNLFVARNDGAGYCMQAGYNPGKSYPIPSNVSFTNNIFQRGANGHCGIYGVATAYYTGNGDVWTGNMYDDGSTVPAP